VQIIRCQEVDSVCMLQYGDCTQQAAFQGVQSLPAETGCPDGSGQIRHVSPTSAT